MRHKISFQKEILTINNYRGIILKKTYYGLSMAEGVNYEKEYSSSIS